jgi:hypothetical protein
MSIARIALLLFAALFTLHATVSVAAAATTSDQAEGDTAAPIPSASDCPVDITSVGEGMGAASVYRNNTDTFLMEACLLATVSQVGFNHTCFCQSLLALHMLLNTLTLFIHSLLYLTLPYLYLTLPVPYLTCTLPYLYLTLPVPYLTCTLPYGGVSRFQGPGAVCVATWPLLPNTRLFSLFVFYLTRCFPFSRARRSSHRDLAITSVATNHSLFPFFPSLFVIDLTRCFLFSRPWRSSRRVAVTTSVASRSANYSNNLTDAATACTSMVGTARTSLLAFMCCSGLQLNETLTIFLQRVFI